MLMTIAVNKNDQLASIKQVERGLKCDCFCFECGEQVLAKKGEKNEHHFAHISNKESCNINPESILHKFAKQVIMEEKGLTLPALPNSQETESKVWQFSKLIAEQSVGTIRPDLVASFDHGMMFIEIAVTSFIDTDKLNLIKHLGIQTVEIDLRDLLKQNIEIPSEEARAYILNEVSNKKWVYPLPPMATPIVQPSVDLPVLPSTTSHEQPTIQIQTPKSDFVKYRFTIQGVWVDVWAFADGGVSVKCVTYHPETIALLKAWKNEGGGSYSPKFKSWRYHLPFANTVLQRLQQLDTTPKA